MTTKQMEVVWAAVQSAFAHLTDAEVAEMVMEPFVELRPQALRDAA